MSTWNKHYHWKTKGCTPWARQWFESQMVGKSAELSDGTTVEVQSLDSFEGDVELGNRKGRLITIFDATISLRWAAGDANGAVQFPEVSHEVQDEDREYPFEVTVSSSGSSSPEALADGVKKGLVPQLLAVLRSFREALISQHANDLGFDKVPSGTQSRDSPAPASAAGTASSKPVQTASASENKQQSSSREVRASADLAIDANDLWHLLTSPERIPMWTKAPAQFEARQGGAFSLFGGNVSGTTTAVDAPTRLEQQWRLSQWPPAHYATLTTKLTQGTESTKLELSLTGVPSGTEDASEAGLNNYYIRALQSMGLGTIL